MEEVVTEAVNQVVENITETTNKKIPASIEGEFLFFNDPAARMTER